MFRARVRMTDKGARSRKNRALNIPHARVSGFSLQGPAQFLVRYGIDMYHFRGFLVLLILKLLSNCILTEPVS